MAILFGGAPTCLVEEHVEDVALLSLIDVIEVLVQIVELEEAIWDKVVFDTLVLKITIHYFDELQVRQCEADQLIGGLILVEGDHQWPVKPIVAEQLKLLRIVISS